MSDRQRLILHMPRGTVYIYGTVNGEPTVWTNVEENVWETVAPAAEDETYHLALRIAKDGAHYYEAALTLYYGVLGLIFDRTQADVSRAEYLGSKRYQDMTESERAEWDTALKGFYNASDLNRVGSAIRYVTKRLAQYGYSVDTDPKTDWSTGDIPTPEQMERYLHDVRALRDKLKHLPSMPPAPDDMEELTYIEANNIERILRDVNAIINNIIASFVYSGEVFCGEVI